jgi:DNA-binding GntR family transcriptional regulator
MRKVKTEMPDLGQQVYEKLRTAILDGELVPGSPLSRRKLADLFSVSTLPVTAALQRLETEGFVESRPRAGTRVKVPTREEVIGNYVVREALESQAARLFVTEANSKQRKRIQKLAARLDRLDQRLAETGNPAREKQAEVEKLHVEFHIEVARATGCEELVEAIERSRVLLFNWLFSRSGPYRSLPKNWHVRLAEVLAKGSVLEADAAMREHVTYRRQEILDRFNALTQAEQDTIERGPQKARAKIHRGKT